MKAVLSWGLMAGLLAVVMPGFAADAAPAAPAAPAMNEISGVIQSIDPDNRVLRVLTADGFNVQFSYDRNTVCKTIGAPQTVDDLAFKDQVIVRYEGRDLTAREIEKRNVQPAVAASSPSTPTN